MRFFTPDLLKKQSLFMARMLLLTLAVISCGLGPTLVQLVGWATMIPTELSKTGSFSQAIENTFSGEHPCQFCALAEELTAAEAEPTEQTPDPVVPTETKKLPPLFTENETSRPLFRGSRAQLARMQSDQPLSEVSLNIDSPPPQQVLALS